MFQHSKLENLCAASKNEAILIKEQNLQMIEEKNSKTLVASQIRFGQVPWGLCWLIEPFPPTQGLLSIA